LLEKLYSSKLKKSGNYTKSTITRYVFERSTRPTRSTQCLVRRDWLPIVLLAVNTLPRHAGPTLAVINNACLLTCDTSSTVHRLCSHMDAGYYNFGRRLSQHV